MGRTEHADPAPVAGGAPLHAGRERSARRQRAIDQLGDVIPALKRRVIDHAAADAAHAGVTPHQADALCMLSREGALSMNDLARNLNIAMSTATALADRLLKQGQVQRIPDPADRRVVRLALTVDAAETVRIHMGARREALHTALDALDDDELEALIALLGKVAEGPPTTTGGRSNA